MRCPTGWGSLLQPSQSSNALRFPVSQAQVVEEKSMLTVAEEAELDRIRLEWGSRFSRCYQYYYPCPEGKLIDEVNGIKDFSRRFPPE